MEIWFSVAKNETMIQSFKTDKIGQCERNINQ